jgi:hypothetical protein
MHGPKHFLLPLTSPLSGVRGTHDTRTTVAAANLLERRTKADLTTDWNIFVKSIGGMQF